MKLLTVLLVEDNPADADLTRDTLETSRLAVELAVANDGVEAIEYLRGCGPRGDRGRPDLVLLDLNLPRLDGRRVLEEIKTDASLRDIPVVVLTSSDADSDVAQSYRLGANCYVIKPGELHAFQRIVETLEGFWLRIARLPPGAAAPVVDPIRL